MASPRNSQAITWTDIGGSSQVTLSVTTPIVSDAVTFVDADVTARLFLHADLTGTPAAGDVLHVSIAYTGGDILNDGGNDYDTPEHAEPLGLINLYPTDTPGEDPGRKSFPIDATPLGFKLVLQAPQGPSRAVQARAFLVTHRNA